MIRAYDWSLTPLGPADAWPRSLKTAIDIMLAGGFPMALNLGLESVQLYNDAFSAVIGDRHPAALGQSALDTYFEARSLFESLFERVRQGETVTLEDEFYPLLRNGKLEDAWFTVTFSPLRDEHNEIYGVFATLIETTERIKVERWRKQLETELREREARQAFLLKLSDRLRRLRRAEEITAAAAELLGHYLDVGGVAYSENDEEAGVAVIDRDWTDGSMPSLAGRHRMPDFVKPFFDEFLAGRTVYVEDTLNDARTVGEITARAQVAASGIRAGVSVPLVKENRVVSALSVYQAMPRQWRHDELWLIEEVAERTWAAVERARAEAALRASEDRYRRLFNSIDEGFCLIEVIFDASNRPTDYRFLEANPAFDELTGLHGATGKRMRELAPDHEQHWFDIYGRIALTGVPKRFTNIAKQLDNRWYDVYAFRVGKPEERKLAVIFKDITAQKRVEIALRESEARQSFLLTLGDAFVAPADTRELMTNASEHLGRHLGADRTGYAEMDDDGEVLVIECDWTEKGLQSLAGRHRLSDLDELITEFRAGRTLAVHDIADSPLTPEKLAAAAKAADVRAGIGVPLFDGGRLKAILFVHQREPRHWTAQEISLVSEVGRRTWGAIRRMRAETALAASESRLSTLVQGMPQLVWCAVEGGRWIWSSAQWTAFTGLSGEQSRNLGWLDAVHPEDLDDAVKAWSHAQRNHGFEANYRLRHQSDGKYRWFQTRATPVRDQRGQLIEWLGTSTDVDDLRQLQEEQKVMLGELQHRTRNLITVIRAIASQTARASDSLENFESRFSDRLAALARVQGLLSNANHELITMGMLIRMELGALGIEEADRIRVDGPETPLCDSSIQTLALAVHELATNARKYGSLSSDQGRLSVTWRVVEREHGRRTLAFEWREEGVLQQENNAIRFGYGRQLIERGLPYALGAKTTYELGRSGVRCTIDIPLDK